MSNWQISFFLLERAGLSSSRTGLRSGQRLPGNHQSLRKNTFLLGEVSHKYECCAVQKTCLWLLLSPAVIACCLHGRRQVLQKWRPLAFIVKVFWNMFVGPVRHDFWVFTDTAKTRNLFVGVFHANYGRPQQSDNNHSNAFWWFLVEHPLCNWFHQATANNLEKLLTNWLWNAHFSVVTSGCYGVVNWSVSLCNWHLNLKLLEVGSYLLHTHKSLILAISIFPKLKNLSKP